MNYFKRTYSFIAKIKLVLYFAINYFRYEKYGLRSLVIHPLRINGRQYISIGTRVIVNKFCWLMAYKIDNHNPQLEIGNGSRIGDFNHIVAVRKVIIGKKVLTANYVYISDNLHSFENIHQPIMDQPVVFKSEVEIGDGTWIGEHVSIIGAKIGKNCVIGSNSVVTNDIPDYCVAVGSPARIIKQYNTVTNQWGKI